MQPTQTQPPDDREVRESMVAEGEPVQPTDDSIEEHSEEQVIVDERAAVEQTQLTDDQQTDLAEDDSTQDMLPVEAVDATEESSREDILPVAQEPVKTAAESGAAVQDLRTRWQAAQLRFVDDPPGVAAEAKALVAEAIHSLTERQRELDGTELSDSDTEQLRIAVARYRELFDQLVPR